MNKHIDYIARDTFTNNHIIDSHNTLLPSFLIIVVLIKFNMREH